jgi:hypothetical protein
MIQDSTHISLVNTSGVVVATIRRCKTYRGTTQKLDSCFIIAIVECCNVLTHQPQIVATFLSKTSHIEVEASSTNPW